MTIVGYTMSKFRPLYPKYNTLSEYELIRMLYGIRVRPWSNTWDVAKHRSWQHQSRRTVKAEAVAASQKSNPQRAECTFAIKVGFAIARSPWSLPVWLSAESRRDCRSLR
jgi:hypothetical protein